MKVAQQLKRRSTVGKPKAKVKKVQEQAAEPEQKESAKDLIEAVYPPTPEEAPAAEPFTPSEAQQVAPQYEEELKQRLEALAQSPGEELTDESDLMAPYRALIDGRRANAQANASHSEEAEAGAQQSMTERLRERMEESESLPEAPKAATESEEIPPAPIQPGLVQAAQPEVSVNRGGINPPRIEQFDREPDDPQERFREQDIDLISLAVGSDAYIYKHTWEWFNDLRGYHMTVSRFYFEQKFALDIFTTEGVDVEEQIKRKRRLLKERGIKYLPVRKGESVTAGRIRDILAGDE